MALEATAPLLNCPETHCRIAGPLAAMLQGAGVGEPQFESEDRVALMTEGGSPRREQPRHPDQMAFCSGRGVHTTYLAGGTPHRLPCGGCRLVRGSDHFYSLGN